MAPVRPVVFSDLFGSELGWIGLQWTPRGIIRLTFGHPSASAAADQLRNGRQEDWKRDRTPQVWRRPLQDFAAGLQVDFRRLPVDLPARTRFQRRVLTACRQIAYGSTLTYRQLASRAGSPSAARAVGQVLARNPVPLIIPCHRVVGSAGRLGGFSAPDGLAMKRRLLALEARRCGVPRGVDEKP